MNASDMANAIIAGLNKSNDAVEANNRFYKSLCDYVEASAEVHYSWDAKDPGGSPDGTTKIQAKIKTSGSLSPNGATDCSSALAAFSGDLNKNASTWQVDWPSGFSMSPAFVIPSITVTPSMADNQAAAMLHVCQNIIDGLKKATPSVPGTHSSYTGTASFIELK